MKYVGVTKTKAFGCFLWILILNKLSVIELIVDHYWVRVLLVRDDLKCINFYRNVNLKLHLSYIFIIKSSNLAISIYFQC